MNAIKPLTFAPEISGAPPFSATPTSSLHIIFRHYKKNTPAASLAGSWNQFLLTVPPHCSLHFILFFEKKDGDDGPYLWFNFLFLLTDLVFQLFLLNFFKSSNLKKKIIKDVFFIKNIFHCLLRIFYIFALLSSKETPQI